MQYFCFSMQFQMHMMKKDMKSVQDHLFRQMVGGSVSENSYKQNLFNLVKLKFIGLFVA